MPWGFQSTNKMSPIFTHKLYWRQLFFYWSAWYIQPLLFTPRGKASQTGISVFFAKIIFEEFGAICEWKKSIETTHFNFLKLICFDLVMNHDYEWWLLTVRLVCDTFLTLNWLLIYWSLVKICWLPSWKIYLPLFYKAVPKYFSALNGWL